MRCSSIAIGVIGCLSLAALEVGCASSPSKERVVAEKGLEKAMPDSDKAKEERADDKDLCHKGGKWDPVKCGGGEGSGDAVELGITMRQAVGMQHGDAIESDANWSSLEKVGLSGKPGARPVAITFSRPGQSEPFSTYFLVPWQALAGKTAALGQLTIPPQLLTVMEAALLFGPVSGSDVSEEAQVSRAKVEATLMEALALEENQRRLSDKLEGAPPEGLQILSIEVRRFYVRIQIALPGSVMPEDAVLLKAAPGKMIELTLTPDMGPRTIRWLSPRASSAEKGS